MPNKHNEIEKDWFRMATVERQLKTLVKEDYLNNYERCKTEFTTVLDLAKMDLRYIIQNLENAEKKQFPLKIKFFYQQKSFLEKLIAELDCDNPKKENLDISENLDNKVQLPENLKELFSIWNNADKQTLIDIYDKHKEFLKPTGIDGKSKRGQKKRLYCFANELNKKNWIKYDGVASDIAKIFNDTFGFKNHHDDYENYQFEINKYKYNNSLINSFDIVTNVLEKAK
mgnify:CR=1 FL=1